MVRRGGASSGVNAQNEQHLSDMVGGAVESIKRRRFSGTSIAMLIVLVVGALTIFPTLQNVVNQRHQINELKGQVSSTKAEIAKIKAANAKWNDPAYVQSQARSRLYLVLPGETTYITITGNKDVSHDTVADVRETSKNVVVSNSSWWGTLLQSVGTAATAKTSSEGK